MSTFGVQDERGCGGNAARRKHERGEPMLRGLSTVSFWAADLAAARTWYAAFLGIDPYFERPGYIEFRLGGFQHELGVIDSRYAPDGAGTGPGGAVVYWHVDDVRATLEKLLSMGANEYHAPTHPAARILPARRRD